MTQTITAFFDSRSDATEAVEELVEAGMSRSSIRILPDTDTAVSPDYDGQGYDAHRDEKGFWASLGDFFFPDDDRYTYAEAMHRGSIMVSATVEEDDAETAIDILEELGTVNLDERESTWRSEGWQGYRPEPRGNDPQRERAIPIVEEELTVGKRQVSEGHVKVRSHVVETPVSEEVELRRESVHVERRPVDRPVAEGDDPFRERTIEAQAVSEEAIISKRARVTEEVVLSKESDTRRETITDKVRRTEVEVEDDSDRMPRRQSR